MNFEDLWADYCLLLLERGLAQKYIKYALWYSEDSKRLYFTEDIGYAPSVFVGLVSKFNHDYKTVTIAHADYKPFWQELDIDGLYRRCADEIRSIRRLRNGRGI